MPNDPNGDEPIVIILDNTGDDNTVKFESDDIEDKTIAKIGSYLSEKTRETHNSPQLVPRVRETSIRSSTGKPSALTDSSNSVDEDFLESLNEASEPSISSFRNMSNSGMLGDFKVRKGKVDSDEDPTIIDVIDDINANGESSKLSSAISRLQNENNRYSKGNEYLSPDENNDEEERDIGRAVLQSELGTHTPRRFPDAQGDKQEIVFGIKKLKNLGIQTLLEASGEYFVPDDTEDFASIVAAKAASTAPGIARLGVRIPVNRFSAAEIARQVDSKFEKESRFPRLDGNTIYSYGNPNNPLVPFDAISSTSSGVAAILLTLTISALVKALAALVGPDSVVPRVPSISDLGSFFGDSGGSSMDASQYRKKRLGSHRGKDVRPNSVGTLGSLIGSPESNLYLLTPTQYPYDKCVSRGASIFFGENGTIENQLLGAIGASVGFDTGQFRQVSQSPGYFNVLLRMLIRSTTEAVGSAVNTVIGLGANIVGETNPVSNNSITKGPLDINQNIGLSNDPTNILNVFNSIREAKIFKFMQILANLGDIGLMIDERFTGENFESTIDGVNDVIEVDGKSYPFPNPAAIVKKNRLSSNVRSRFKDNLAWGSNTLRSMYLLPTSFASAEYAFSNKQPITRKMATDPNFATWSVKNRLSKEDVQKIEDEIDAYYMPFYFHDLRTNEIITFHAFIESITDAFDAEYTESDGYGRIGKISTYKNTNRSIACSFRVVSTNQADFSDMWYKINKLVMLLYPQYTAGREVSYTTDGEEKKFTQPFSQLIGNSPMIRFRVGDLIKSNYSDLDLARLFGLGTDKFNVGDELTRGQKMKIYEELQGETEKILDRIYDYDFQPDDVFFILNDSIAGSRGSDTRILKYRSSKRIPKLSSEVRVRVVRRYSDSAKKYEVRLDPPVAGIDDNLIADFTGLSSNIHVREDWDFVDQVLSEKRVELVNNTEQFESFENADKISKFFSPEENPVVKSFESVKGQGLAGFIKRLSMDWSDARWETEGLNNRAPMWCKIDIDFSPVHDINPGLDSSGAPIGMPYNVGSLLKLMKAKRSSAENSDSVVSTNYASKKAQSATPTNNVDGDDSSVQFADVFPGGF